MSFEPADSDDALAVYLSLVQRVPPMEPGEEIECIRRVQTGGELAETALRRLMEANLRLVIPVAERYSDRFGILQLIEKGNAGLLHAIQTLQEMDQGDFSTYALAHIEQAIAEFTSTSPAADLA